MKSTSKEHIKSIDSKYINNTHVAQVPSDALETLVPRLPRLFELFAAEAMGS